MNTVKLIVGNNASGKTRYLEECYTYCIIERGKRCLYNIKPLNDYKLRYPIIPLYYIKGDLMISLISDDIKVVNNELVLDTEEYVSRFSDIFKFIVDLLLRDVDYVFLDEPDITLTKDELQSLFNILYLVDLNKTIIIASHDEIFLSDTIELYDIEQLKKEDNYESFLGIDGTTDSSTWEKLLAAGKMYD